MKHSNISIFIPHLGCPFNCIFCDQYKITGSDKAVTPLNVDQILSNAVKSGNLTPDNTQIAFFGGSFTAIDKKLMISYLEIAYKYIKDGHFDSIRISTRPDCINQDILDILKRYGVKTIELGIQSFDDEVLNIAKRGHNAATALKSCELISNNGFELGLQMMCGLPGDTFEKDLYTAKIIASTKCNQVRIYPVVVIDGTHLAKMYKSGEYTPLDTESAVKICAKLCKFFKDNNITVLKVGLHSDSDNIAGPFHPAFGELVRSYIFYDEITEIINKDKFYQISVSPNLLSIAIGNGKSNIKRFKNEGYNVIIKQDENLSTDYSIIENT